MVKSLPSSSSGTSSISGQGTRILPASETLNRSNIITNSITILKNGPHEKKEKKKKAETPLKLSSLVSGPCLGFSVYSL